MFFWGTRFRGPPGVGIAFFGCDGPREGGGPTMAGRGDGSGREYFKWGGLGFEFAGVVAVCTYLGYLADQRWQSDPWGTIAGAGLGVTGGIYWLAKESLRMMKELGPPQERDEDQQNGE